MIRQKNDETLGAVLKKMMNQKRFKSKLDKVRIQSIWEKNMGTLVVKYTKHVTLRKNTLVILVESSPLKQELSYGKEKIIKIFNEELGEELIKDVIIH